MKKKNSTENPELQTFMITIQDEHHSCVYPFRLPKNISFVDIAKVISKKFKVETPKGKFSADTGLEF